MLAVSTHFFLDSVVGFTGQVLTNHWSNVGPSESPKLSGTALRLEEVNVDAPVNGQVQMG